MVQARLTDPLADLTAPGHRKGIWFGPGPDDQVSAVVERRADGTYVTIRAEQAGVSQVIGELALTGPVATLDLVLTADLVAGTVQGSVRVDGVEPATVVGTAFVPFDVMSWFSPQGRAGDPHLARLRPPPAWSRCTTRSAPPDRKAGRPAPRS